MDGEAVLTRRLIYPKKRGHTEISGQCLICGKVEDYAEDYARDYPFNVCEACRAKLSRNYVYLVERINGEDGDQVKLTGRYAKISRGFLKQLRPEVDTSADLFFVVFPSTFYFAVCMEYISKLRPLVTAKQIETDRLQRKNAALLKEVNNLLVEEEKLTDLTGPEADRLREKYRTVQKDLKENEEEGKRLKAETAKLQGDLETYEGLLKAVQADIAARSPEEREETYKEMLRQVDLCEKRRLRT